MARLLAGCDPHVAADEDTPSPVVEPERAPGDPGPVAPGPIPTDAIPTDPISTDGIPNEPVPTACESADLPADHAEYAVPRRTSARARSPYSSLTVSLLITAAAVLIFGSGLGVGYGFLRGHPKTGSRAPVEGGEPSVVRKTAPSKIVGDQASVPNAADAPAVNSTVPLPELSAPAPTTRQAGVLAENGDKNNLQRPAAEARSRPSRPTQATTEPPAVPADSSVTRESLASIHLDPGQRTATAEQPVSIPSSRPPPSDDAKQASETSAQSAQPGRAPVESAPSANVSKAPDTLATTALPDAGPAAPEAHRLADKPPEKLGGPVFSSPGQIDPCQLVHSVHPVYPEKARKLHVEGNVELRVVVGVDGIVRSVGLVSGPPLLVMAAIDAAREFRYKPALLNGKPIETVQTVDMSFKLKN
ncbi:MAG TPA: TonB family protein [Candidatus Acidoferrales bacterium]|nr:TonB family protein [Candidatus Acidoferrales bacterium]